MPNRIEKLCLDNFRGATCNVEIEFDTSKPAVMVFGENGTGKSTIVDGIDFVCNGNLGSLEDRSIGQSKIQHVPSLNAQPSEVGVSIVFGGDTWQATLSSRGASISGPRCRPSARILRRSQILDVINAQPSERYQAIQSFVEVPGIQRSEDRLREAKRTAEADLNAAVRAQQQTVDALQNYWKAEGSKGEDALKWAAQESQKEAGDLKSTVDSLNSILSAISNAISARTQLGRAEEQHRSTERNQKQAEEALLKAVSESKGAEALTSLIQILQDAEKFMEEKETINSCPVCEQDIDGKDLRLRITQRLQSMQDVIALKNDLENAKRATANKVAIVKQCREYLVVAIQKLSEVAAESDAQQVNKLGIDWSPFSQSAEMDHTTQTQDEQIIELAHNALEIIETCQESLKTDCATTQKSLNQLNAIKGHFTTVEEKTEAAVELDKLSKRLSEMLEVVERQRKKYVEDILASMSNDIEEMYLKVHPNENIGGIRFFLNPQYQHSLEFDGRFEDAEGIPPGAYYSESHLDTLGVCMFLALAKHFIDANTVVVLDDVVTSIDQAHMERFMNLLHDEAANFNQLIITTHYRPWRDRYRYARGPAANVQLIELLHWSLPRGIRHTKTKLSVEELQEYVQQEPMDRQIVSSKAGILLESLLDHIALLYKCRIARKPEPYYTLGELTGCIGRQLRRALKSQFVSEDGSSVTEATLEPILTRIGSLASWIRNQVGCHWNISGMDVADTEVEDLANTMIELANALVCENCGELPFRDRTGSYFECRCGRKRLHPRNNPD